MLPQPASTQLRRTPAVRPSRARWTRSLATSTLAVALAFGGVVSAQSAAHGESGNGGASSALGRGLVAPKARDLRHSSVVGGSDAAAFTLPAFPRTAVDAAGSVSVQAAALTCSPLEAFSRTEDGSLYRMLDTAAGPVAGQTLTETGRVGTGWSAGKLAWVGGGGQGVVYALTWTGDLKWYRYNATSKKWLSGSGRTIATGLIPVKRIVNISVGAGGNIYVVRTDGKLVLFRHRGLTTGAVSWAKSSGWVIGSGFSGKEILVPVGDGTVYRQTGGKLMWFRHTDPAKGAVKWSSRQLLTGWKFYDLLSAGAGVLYATVPGSGQIKVYTHGDPVGGKVDFSGPQGVAKGYVRANSYGLAIDPGACRRA